jgi:hypothetical protein
MCRQWRFLDRRRRVKKESGGSGGLLGGFGLPGC